MKTLCWLFCSVHLLVLAADHAPVALFQPLDPKQAGGLPSTPRAAISNPEPVVTKALPPSGGAMDALDDKQKLGVGDKISFRVLEDQDGARPLTVTDAGQLDVPELGLVSAAGKTCKQLAFEIKPKLEQTTYYQATVIVGIDLLNKTISGRRVYVAGEVRRPGPQEVPAGETWTVSKAILSAGGFTDFADKKKVRVVRAAAKGQPANTLLLNIADVWEHGRTDLDLPVEAEDLILVTGRAVNLY